MVEKQLGVCRLGLLTNSEATKSTKQGFKGGPHFDLLASYLLCAQLTPSAIKTKKTQTQNSKTNQPKKLIEEKPWSFEDEGGSIIIALPSSSGRCLKFL